MKPARTLPSTAMALAVLALASVAALAQQTYTIGPIRIDHPWSRVAPEGFKVAGGFMRITNTGKEADRLIGGSFIHAARLEVHEMAMKDGRMVMNELAGGLEIPPGGSVLLRPGSFHVMFMELKQPLKSGERIKGTLVFAKAGAIEVEYLIEPLGTQTSGPHAAPKGSGPMDKK
ncbi:MAG TPA: copper chaperone PCu(A)C [Hyphomicrobiaceae bacterium]|nr:copper chaperone PCu(A)C [Hyphomicrobiaceae bacterium]